MQGKLEALVAQLLTLPAAMATINTGDKDGLTPLHWASTEGKPHRTSIASSAQSACPAGLSDHTPCIHPRAGLCSEESRPCPLRL